MEKREGRENYLRVILELSQKKEGHVRSVEIAGKLRISKPSVSEMLKKMAGLNLIEFSPYSRIKLTPRGEKLAKEIQQRHEIIEKFAEKLQHSKPHEEAHNLEHHFSEEMISKISEFTDGKRKLEKNPPSYIS